MRGGGVCIYIRNEWGRDPGLVYKHCSRLVEFLIIKCWPSYLPSEFTTSMLVGVYLPPMNNRSDRNEALNELFQAISEQQKAHPDGFIILAGDFNHSDLKTVLQQLHQPVDFPTISCI